MPGNRHRRRRRRWESESESVTRLVIREKGEHTIVLFAHAFASHKKENSFILRIYGFGEFITFFRTWASSRSIVIRQAGSTKWNRRKKTAIASQLFSTLCVYTLIALDVFFFFVPFRCKLKINIFVFDIINFVDFEFYGHKYLITIESVQTAGMCVYAKPNSGENKQNARIYG